MLETLGEEFRAKRIQRRTYQALLEALRPVIGEEIYDTYKLVTTPPKSVIFDAALDDSGNTPAV
jgi:hypothetical protein